VRITQVITNLLTNAVKYTPDGGLIYLGVRMEAQFLVIAVRDSGVGLTREAMDRVFDMFTPHRVGIGPRGRRLRHRPGARQGPGAAARRTPRGQQRRLRPWKRVPRLSAALADCGNNGAVGTSPPTGEKGPTPPPRRILVADDNRDNADSLSMLLKFVRPRGTPRAHGSRRVRIGQTVTPPTLGCSISACRILTAMS